MSNLILYAYLRCRKAVKHWKKIGKDSDTLSNVYSRMDLNSHTLYKLNSSKFVLWLEFNVSVCRVLYRMVAI